MPDDPEPLEVHQMQLELRVSLPDLEIRHAEVVFETHPHSTCPLIARDYVAQAADDPARPLPKVPKSPGVKSDDSLGEAGRKVLRMHLARMLEPLMHV